MPGFIAVSKVDELKDGTMKAVNATGREISLARVGDEYYTVDNRCPHMGAELSKGKSRRNYCHLSLVWLSV